MKAKEGPIRAGARNFLRNSRQYWAVVSWVLVDSVWRFKRQAVVILAAGFLGATLQAAAMGQILYYARALEKGSVVTLLGRRLDPRTSVTLLCVFAVGMLVTLLVSAGMIFYARSRSLKFGCRYWRFCSRRVLEMLSTSHKIWMPQPTVLAGQPDITRMIGNDSRFCGLVPQTLLSAVVPAITFVTFLCLLLYIDWPATVIVLASAGISAIFLYRINRLGARNSRLFEEHTLASVEEKRRILNYLGGISFCGDDLSWLDEPYETGLTMRSLKAYENRLMVVQYCRVLSSVLTAALMCAILLYLGGRALVHGEGWGTLIAYLLVLRRCMTSAQQLSHSATCISRFYPQVSRYRDFIRSTGVRPCAEEPEPRVYELAVEGEALPESGMGWTLKPGDRLGLIGPAPLSRYALAFLVDCLLPGREADQHELLAGAWFGTAQYGAPMGPLGAFLGLAPGASRGDLIAALQPTGLAEKIDQCLPSDLDSPVAPEAWGSYETDVKFALALFAAVRSRQTVIFLEERGLQAMPVQARDYFLQQLSGRILIIVHSLELETAGEYGEDILAVIVETQLVGLGSAAWVVKHRDHIVQAVGPAFEAGGRADGDVEQQQYLMTD